METLTEKQIQVRYMADVPVGTQVVYEGSLKREHGLWTLDGVCACPDGCPLPPPPFIDWVRPQVRYRLVREDRELLHVGRQSFYPAKEA